MSSRRVLYVDRAVYSDACAADRWIDQRLEVIKKARDLRTLDRPRRKPQHDAASKQVSERAKQRMRGANEGVSRRVG